MRKKNMKIKENIYFSDKVNAIEYKNINDSNEKKNVLKIIN